MKILKQILDFYIKSSLHVGFAVLSLVYITAFSNDLCKHIIYPCCVFCGTVFGYNVLKYFEVLTKKTIVLRKYFCIVLVTIITFVGFLFFLNRLTTIVKVQLMLAGIMVFIYPFLRKFGIIKMFLVAFVVAFITAFISFNPKYTSVSWLIICSAFAQRFFILSALMLPFEIADAKEDAKYFDTLPQKFGLVRTKYFGYFLLVVFLIFDIVYSIYNSNFRMQFFLIDIAIAIVTAVFIFYSNENRSQYYTSFWVESVPIFWLALFLIFGQVL